MPDRVEQRPLLRNEEPPGDAVLLVRGGRDSIDKLHRHAERPARRWLLDGVPLIGISVFAALDGDVDGLLARFSSYRFVYTPTVAAVREQFVLLATGPRPHFTIQLPDVSDAVLRRLRDASRQGARESLSMPHEGMPAKRGSAGGLVLHPDPGAEVG